MNKIKSFFEVAEVGDKDDTLVVLDIDETILYYDGVTKQWWRDISNEVFQSCYTFYSAASELNKRWEMEIANKSPIHTDEEGLKNLLATYRCIFLTARAEMEVQTQKEFKHLGIPFKNVYFCGDENKGTVLSSILLQQEREVKHVIFIDDKQHNCDNVQEAMKLKGVRCDIYLFDHDEK